MASREPKLFAPSAQSLRAGGHDVSCPYDDNGQQKKGRGPIGRLAFQEKAEARPLMRGARGKRSRASAAGTNVSCPYDGNGQQETGKAPIGTLAFQEKAEARPLVRGARGKGSRASAAGTMYRAQGGPALREPQRSGQADRRTTCRL